MNIKPTNPAINLAPFGRWTLRDKAATAPVTSTSGTHKENREVQNNRNSICRLYLKLKELRIKFQRS